MINVFISVILLTATFFAGRSIINNKRKGKCCGGCCGCERKNQDCHK